MKSPYTRTIRTIYGSSRGRSPFWLERPQARHRVWLITLALVLLSAAVGASFYFFGQTGPAFTGDRVEVGLSGNEQPAAGRSEEYILTITNKEEVALTGVELFIDFARAARHPRADVAQADVDRHSAEVVKTDVEPSQSDGSLAAKSQGNVGSGMLGSGMVTLISADPAAAGGVGHTWKFSEIKPAESREIKLNLSFLGREGLEITLPMLATFRPSGWGGEFSSRLEQKFKLGKPLVDMSINGPDRVAAGAEAALSVNIKEPASQLAGGEGADGEWLLSLSLPQGFAAIAFEPSPPSSNSSTGAGRLVWPLSLLPRSGDSYALSIRGRVESPAGSELALTALLANQKISSQISAEKKIIVKNTDIEFSLSALPSQGKKTQWGETVNWQTQVKNAGQEKLRNAMVSVSLSGEELWQSGSLTIDNGGSWEAGNIVWDRQSDKTLSQLSPGQKLTLNFRFTLVKAPPALSSAAVILASGRFTAESDGDQIEARSGEVSLKIAANIDLSVGVWYRPGADIAKTDVEPSQSDGSLAGQAKAMSAAGRPHPPLPGQETIYGAEWVLGPSTGALSDARLALVLPKDVAWKEGAAIASGELSYEPGSRTVVWRAANLARRTEPMVIRFTVGVTPGDEATNDLIILGATSFTAKDQASGETLELYAPAVRLGEIK